MSDDARMPAQEPDDEAFAPDHRPILARLEALSPEASAKIGQWYSAAFNNVPLSELNWPSLRQVAGWMHDFEGGAVSAEVRQVLLDLIAALNPLAMAVARRAIANYGIGHARSLLLTHGEVDTAMYVLVHHSEVWGDAKALADGAIERTSTKTFDELVVENAETVATVEAAEALVAANKSAPVELETDPPAGYDDPVPHGAISVIMDWVKPDDHDIEAKADRAHRAMIAEIRRRGAKQRKGLLKGLSKNIPAGWLAPYLRADLPDADTLPHPFEMAEGVALHIIITSSGVRYWQEDLADG